MAITSHEWSLYPKPANTRSFALCNILVILSHLFTRTHPEIMWDENEVSVHMERKTAGSGAECGVMPAVGVSRKSAIAVTRHTRNFGVANANIGQERRCRRHCQPLAKPTRPSYSDWAVQTWLCEYVTAFELNQPVSTNILTYSI